MNRMELDTNKIDDAVLALLYLGLHDEVRAWKGFDWGRAESAARAGIHLQSARESEICGLQ